MADVHKKKDRVNPRVFLPEHLRPGSRDDIAYA